MRKIALLLTIILVLVVGCSGESANPTPTPSPLPTSALETPTAVTSSGPATCVLEPLDFPVNPSIPPVTEVDHVHGPDDAPITFIEYADFQ